jgi:hypothetical protein
VTALREHRRQGPSSDPNRDGCGPAALLILAGLAVLVWAVVLLVAA